MDTFLRRMCYRMSRRDTGRLTRNEGLKDWNEAMKMVGIADNIVNLFENSKESWRKELTAYNESLGEVDIRKRIFQGHSFSPLLFVVVLIPLLIILNETDLGYATSRNQKLNHLLFIDGLKLYAKIERELDSLILTVRFFLMMLVWYLVWTSVWC